MAIKTLSTLSGLDDVRGSTPLSGTIQDYDIFEMSLSGTTPEWASTKITYAEFSEALSATLKAWGFQQT